MRVAFVNHNGAQPGGAEATLLIYLKKLPAEIEPVVFTFGDGEFADSLRAHGIPVEIFPVSKAISDSTRERPRLDALWTLPAGAVALARRFEALGIDLVFTNSMKAHVVGLAAAKLSGRPAVLYLHDIISGRARNIIRAMGAFCSNERLACAPIVARELGLSDTTVLYGAPIEFDTYSIPWTQAEARAALGIPADGVLFAIIGRINRWKGQDRFVRAAAQVLERGINARFAIVGSAIFRDTDFPAEVQALVTDLGLQDRITFHPWQAEPRLVYAAADVNVNCSEREPFARTTVEAAAAQRPTICFDDGGTCEAIENGISGFVVPALNVGAMADAMTKLVEQPNMLAAAKSAAAVRAQKYDARVLATTFVDTLYRTAHATRP